MAEPITLITGASVGIGAELARVFAAHGHRLVLAARREAAMEQLASEIAALGGPRPEVVPIDLCLPDAGVCIVEALAQRGLEPEYVVNNAGFGLIGMAAQLDRREQLAMIDLNIRMLTDLSLAWTDSLVRYRGGILNVASISAFFPGPGMAVYYASKAYVLSFGEALHQELKPLGVRVTTLCPGPVPTQFQARAGFRKDATSPTVLTMSAARVAEAGYRGLMRGRRVVIPGLGNKVVTAIVRVAPRRPVIAVASRELLRRR